MLRHGNLDTRTRLMVQLASIIAGGPAPLIATALFAWYHSGYAIAVYILACAVVSLISAALLKDYTNKDIAEEYDAHLLPGASVQAALLRTRPVWGLKHLQFGSTPSGFTPGT